MIKSQLLKMLESVPDNGCIFISEDGHFCCDIGEAMLGADGSLMLLAEGFDISDAEEVAEDLNKIPAVNWRNEVKKTLKLVTVDGKRV